MKRLYIKKDQLVRGWRCEIHEENTITAVSQVDGRPPVLTATSQSNGNGQTLTTHGIQTP